MNPKDRKMREKIARRAATELKDGMYVNLGIGMPTMTSNFLDKNKTVYIFGGYSDFTTAHSDCQAYNIETKQFRDIGCYPQRSYGNTAANFENKIYVCGYHMNKVYWFDEKTLHEMFSVEGEKFKVVCSGWIVVHNKLYEMTDESSNEWRVYSILVAARDLNSCCVFKRKKYIYYVDGSKILTRINTETHVVEKFLRLSN